MNSGEYSDGDIAIIGMAVRVPGARNAQEFWNNLRGGVESIRDVSEDELIQAGEKPERLRKKNYVRRTADMPDMEMFDAEFFGLSPKEAAIMDPQHRQFLECSWEAMEAACRTPEHMEGPIGIFAGCGMGSYFYFNVCSHKGLVDETGMFLLRHTGNDKDFLSTRVSYAFDLRGPSVNVQTACSTSLVAVHYACQSLLNGECDMALAGGSTIELPHRRGYLYQDGEILSPDGHCRAFDHRAAGTVFGSGTGVVVLRRLADALADGDPIRAVIKSTAINNDGASKAGYLAPSVSGQAAAIVEALAIADIPADSIQYVECHGTGTYLGDPIEIEALTQAFRQSTANKGFCRVGSVKTNIGHLDTAAGVVSLIKTALALENREIPPSLGFEKPNPAINFADSPFVVNDRLTPWTTSGVRRAGVNSLGVGGTNAHAVLQEAPPRTIQPKTHAEAPQILLLSARTNKAVGHAVERLGAFLAANDEVSLGDISYTLAKGRRRFEHNSVVAARGRDDAAAVLSSADQKRVMAQSIIEDLSGAVFLFPGGGAQYPGMGKSLYRHEAAFRSTVDEGLSYLPDEVAAEIRQLWLDDSAADAAKRLLKPSLQLPAILIIEIAIARLLGDWGIKPKAMIGHSMGENAAACIAGVLSYENTVRLVRLRGELFDEITGGGMLSVALSHEELERRLPETLDIASVNAPQLCVVSGSDEDLERFRNVLLAEEIEANRIPIDIAAHSRQLEAILSRFEAFLRSIPLSAPQIPIVSNLTGEFLTADQATDPIYWTTHLRSTVRFSDCVQMVARTGRHFYIETGPGRALSSLVKMQDSIVANQVANSLPHPDEVADDQLHFLGTVGRCWAAGLEVNIERQWKNSTPQRIPLPTYPFQHQRYFLDALSNVQSQDGETFTKIAEIADWGWQPVWRQSVPDIRMGADERPSSWLIFLDDTGAGEKIAARLRKGGHRVVTVAPGDAFAKLGEYSYALCDEDGRPAYETLMQELAANGGIPEKILHLGLLTGAHRFRPGSSFFHQNQERGFFSLFYLGQALAEADVAPEIQITVVTNGMQRVGKESLPYPEKATVLGPALVLPKEVPSISVRVIDLPASDDARPAPGNGFFLTADHRHVTIAPELIDQLWDDLFAENGNEIVAYRNGRRWRYVHEKLKLDAPEKGSARFREHGVYMLTGGLGGLGSVFALDLARRYKAKLILTGRTELPGRESWNDYLATYGDSDRIGKAIATIQAIEDAGGEVLYASADVIDAEAMTALVAEAKARFGAIHGLLHMAGIVKDELIQLKEPGDINDVFAPKIMGLTVLAEALANEPLDLIVLFSSTSTDIAPAGQVDYVAANAFLNAFAESRALDGAPHVVSVHWGVWKDTGLAARAIKAIEQDNDAPASITTIDNYLFDRHIRDSDGREVFEGRWDAERQWILNEHRLANGEAVWPGTGYIEALSQALAASGINGAYEIADLTFLRPLAIPDGAARIARVALEKLGGAREKVTIESKSASDEMSAGWTLHAEATVRPYWGAKRDTADVEQIASLCDGKVVEAQGEPLRSAQEAHLNFGPRWKVLHALHLGEGQAMARLELPGAFVGDLNGQTRMHPALMDIATGYAMELIRGYDQAASLWVPMSYGRIRVLRPLPRQIWSHVRLNGEDALGQGYAVFDVTIYDANGQPLVEIEKFTITQLGQNADFAAKSQHSAIVTASRSQPVAATQELPPALARLAEQVENGIAPEEGVDALMRAIGAGVPQVVVSSMDLPTLQRATFATKQKTGTGVAFERPTLDNDFVAPRNEIEETLAGYWSELLGVQTIGVHDNFFDLGGHSLIAVRLFRMVKKAFAVDFPISVLFEAPTVAQCAALIEVNGGVGNGPKADNENEPPKPERKFIHLVQMNPGKNPNETPFFICAGMFGNILNLRHLAIQVGHDRPVYGLQARGLYGEQAPHETFEEMARDYLEEIRAVQPQGPYLLGGFSGGGLAAFEMAQQLMEAGENVAMLTLLDTPYPEDVSLSVRDRIAIRTQDIKREGTAFFIRYIKWRIEWERQRLRERNAEPASAEQFHSREVQAAFMRALSRYQAKAYGGQVLLLRPRLRVAYRLPDGRVLNSDRGAVHADNGWSPYVRNLAIVEVPGDHDGMVLEPNVRVLAGHLRKALNQSEWGLYPSIAAE